MHLFLSLVILSLILSLYIYYNVYRKPLTAIAMFVVTPVVSSS